tara:strand:- start:333 stop:824 length:492 start_codon:yes stop_codon:yes gene_type:complete
MKVPYTNFKTFSGEWKEIDTVDLFENKRVVVFAQPGAFSPSVATQHLLGYEGRHHELMALGIADVYCVSVNDTFVMDAWFNQSNIKKVKPLADGEGVFTQGMGMLVNKPKQGLGMRSWRYSMLVDNSEVVKVFEEPGKNHSNDDDDPFTVSDVDTMIKYLKGL